MRRVLSVVTVLVLGLQPISHTQTSRLQIHFMDVGQGDGAILLAPSGETVLFDNGVWNQCTKPTNYLTSLGLTKVDYQIISHYHRDHYGDVPVTVEI